VHYFRFYRDTPAYPHPQFAREADSTGWIPFLMLTHTPFKGHFCASLSQPADPLIPSSNWRKFFEWLDAFPDTIQHYHSLHTPHSFFLHLLADSKNWLSNSSTFCFVKGGNLLIRVCYAAIEHSVAKKLVYH